MGSPHIMILAVETIQRVLHDKGAAPAEISESTLLLGSSLGIDSLDLATIVVQLSEATGKDPFEDGFVDFRTVGELVRIYSA